MTQRTARVRQFEWLEQGPRSAGWCSPTTPRPARYPFAFRLEVTYSVDGADLDVAARHRQYRG